MARVQFPEGPRDFSLFYSFQTGSGVHPASYPVDTGCSFPGVKQLGCEADHSPPSNAEVKNGGSCTTAPSYVSMAWDSITLPYICGSFRIFRQEPDLVTNSTKKSLSTVALKILCFSSYTLLPAFVQYEIFLKAAIYNLLQCIL
jgi:hypothetical protein